MASSASRQKRSLRYFLIEPFKQVKLGVYVIGISLAFTSIAGVMIFQAVQAQYNQVMEIFSVVDPTKQWSLMLNSVFISNAVKLAILFGSYLVLLMGVVVSKTHKVYGPIVSIERFIEQMSKGNYWARVQIREGDELRDLVNKLNELAACLQAKHGAPERRKDDPINLESDDLTGSLQKTS